MFSRGAIFLAVLLFTLQDEVFAQNSTIFVTPSSASAFVTATQSGGMNSTQQTISTTSSTVTGTDSTRTSATTPTTPPSGIPDSSKTCGSLTVTMTYADKSHKPSDKHVNATIRDGLFSNSTIFKGVKKTDMEIDRGTAEKIEVVLTFCLDFKHENAHIEDLAKKEFKTLFNETINIHLTLDAKGVKLEWKPVGDECKKCGSSGAGGPFSIKQECTPEDHSCKGLKLDTAETQDCNKYCPGDSGPVPIVTSFFILPVGLAMFLSFYLWE